VLSLPPPSPGVTASKLLTRIAQPTITASYCGVPFIGGEALGLGGSLLLSRLASASCFFLKASYSGVPGLGGISFGAPPNHSGA
jgi:hypothetical protein